MFTQGSKSHVTVADPKGGSEGWNPPKMILDNQCI